MTILDWLLVGVESVLIIVGMLFAAVLWQVSVLLAAIRGPLLCQFQNLLGEAQKSLTHVESITHDVDRKLARLDSTVADAQVAAHAVAETTRFVSEGVARPVLINFLAIASGTRAAWQHIRTTRQRPVSGLGHAETAGPRLAPAGTSPEPEPVGPLPPAPIATPDSSPAKCATAPQ